MIEVRLTVLNGPEPQMFALRPPEVVIGRGLECDFRIRARAVSRRHCRIVFYPTHVAIEDLNSTNGTFVNGQRVTAGVALKSGDIIRVGTAVFRVELVAPAHGMSAAGESVSHAPLVAPGVEDEPPSVFVKLKDQPPGEVPPPTR